MSHHAPFEEVEASRPDFETSYKANFTKVPQPGFIPGTGLNSQPFSSDFDPNGPFRDIDPADMEAQLRYKLMISAITPRPVGFISTQGLEGERNLAPMSFFNMVCHNPPTIMVSIATADKKPKGLKDSTNHIMDTKQFCVSIISESFIEAANYTAIDAPIDVSEWKLSGLTQRKSHVVAAPHVAESGFSMECELVHSHDLMTDEGDPSYKVMLGRVRMIHVKEAITKKGDAGELLVASEKLRPIARFGGITYSRSTQFMEITRPVWDKVKDTPEIKDVLDKPEKQVE